MPEEKYTRCPGCATVFRVTPEQLALRNGQVRCGHCKTVFDGVAESVSLAAPALPDLADPLVDEASLGPPTVTLRESQALEVPGESPVATASTPAADDVAEVPYEDRFSSPARLAPSHARTIAYAAGIVLLVLAIVAQGIFHFRDTVAAHWPPARPALEGMCKVVGCAIRPLRDAAMTFLSIEASDLQADPAHRGLLVLTATLRNRAAWSVSYPYLELTLTDAQDRVVVRRALAPSDYAGGTVNVPAGIGSNAEVAVKVFIDASATAQAGYRLYMFYP